MTASAYHLFCDIYHRRSNLALTGIDAEQFMLRDDLIAARGGRGGFPDLILRTNQNDHVFQGGEFIEMKDAKTSANKQTYQSPLVRR